MHVEKIINRLSIPAFALSMLFFAGANFYSYKQLDYDFVGKTDFATVCGFPFTAYYFSGWGAGLVWVGIIENCLAAVAVSIVVSVIWKVVRRSN